MKNLLTTAETAERLGVKSSRVRQLILAGRILATKHGRDLFIEEKELKKVANRKRTGRPKKSSPGDTI